MKKALHAHCLELIQKQIDSIRSELASIEESRNNETKSSAGDKYETGRAMMQMAEEKSRMQLSKSNQLRLELQDIDPNNTHEKISKGSLVITDNGKYFISIGLGKVKMENEVYYCISTASPIGIQMREKVAGDLVEFGGRRIKINQVH